ncbi:MAG: hypothetical protein HY271_09825 [Deltaproteobacteria bacterium]|nr:hypothetical protein [Deltaproteobacteria bacterium]
MIDHYQPSTVFSDVLAKPHSTVALRFLALVGAAAIVLTTILLRPCVAAEPPAPVITAVSEDPSDPNTVYAATDAGLFRSTDSGDSWQLVPIAGASSTITAIAVIETCVNNVLF